MVQNNRKIIYFLTSGNFDLFSLKVDGLIMLIQKLIVIQENPCLPACTQTLLKNKESRTLPVPKNMS